MSEDLTGKTVVPLGASLQHIEVHATRMRIRDLSIERAGIVDYLRDISPDKQEVALVHALEVGVTEILARRKRQKPPS
jgi:hypothetical protein